MIIDAPLPPTPEGIDEVAWAAAISAIRNRCEWHIAPVLEETLTLDGSGGCLLVLPTLRMTGLTSVTKDGTLLDPVPESWSERGIIDGIRWPTKRRGIVVVFEHGFEFFPPEILAVARSMASAGRDGTPGRRLTSGPHSVELDPTAAAGPFAIGDLQAAVIERYRVRPRP